MRTREIQKFNLVRICRQLVWRCSRAAHRDSCPLPLQLVEMPSSVMYVGKTSLHLQDIRSFNNMQEQMMYILHTNDCRSVPMPRLAPFLLHSAC